MADPFTLAAVGGAVPRQALDIGVSGEATVHEVDGYVAVGADIDSVG
ncbi:hypothetical protein ACQP2F_02585 [Actinoplanes sp. CA-030573]